MKNLVLIFSFFCLTISLSAQEQQLLLDADSVIRQNPRMAQMMFEPGEVLVRFADEVQININKANGVVKTSITSIDALFEAYEVNEAVQLFPSEVRKSEKKFITTFSGQVIEVPNLHNVYRLFATKDIFDQTKLIEKLDSLDYVVYAEPNYIQSIVNDKPMSPEMNEAEMLAWLEGGNRQNSSKNNKTVVPNDPLYDQQWHIPAVHADLVWDTVQGADSTQIIAILDTGVDWAHPDLQNKIWTNTGEIPDNGIDDDGNGKIDDIRGWDWINNDNNPTDDNSHGTHVAGIAAAEANNEIGISGVSNGAKIMPLKVFQSSGRGNSANIAQGIVYAFQKGATVINMSFGSYARSLAMEDALVNAYSTTVLVAAAGNDGIDVDQCIPSGPFYPAALSYILGVQAPDGAFSNTDCNGPTFSAHPDLLNYEMKAPGTNILSTIPNGNYRVYQGTSMAAPILSGALAMYRPLRSNESMELMWVKLIQSTYNYINIFEALNKVPIPEVRMISQTMIDTMPDCDNDSRVDAGETIKFWFTARNTGGQCDSTWFKIRFHEFEDTTTAQIIKPTSYIGSMSAYATRTSQYDPMVIKINENVAHDRDIVFDLLSWYRGSSDTLVQTTILTVENGEELIGVLDSAKTLFPNRLYILRNSFKVGTNGILTIRPGAKLLVYGGYTIPVNGKVIADGKADSLIHIIGYDWGAGTVFKYRNSNSIKNRVSFCRFENLSWPLSSDNYMNPASVYNCVFINVNNIGVVDSVVNNLYYSLPSEAIYDSKSHFVYRNNFISNSSGSNYPSYPSYGSNNFIENNFINFIMPPVQYTNSNIEHRNNWINKKNTEIIYQTNYQSIADFQEIKYQYWGTSDSEKIDDMIYDFMENSLIPRAVFVPFESAAIDSCHAITWKVLVNGTDAQDEYVEPVGVGPQRFDVYFNHEMDTSFTPQLTFGVRYPYTQQSVSDSARWDSEHKIFTAYKNMQIYTGDGINRIRVAGARDLEGWEIPVEDMRFEFLVDAAGSASTDFMATPGIGKVALEWHEPDDLPTLLGYNMYRFHHITDTTFSDTTLVNTNLVNDTLFTDFSVNPLQRYYYMYKIVRTDFTESDFSKVVNATVLTASPGDANGDLIVNVQDIISIVGHILNQNPQPFLSEAADVNEDGFINLLDIIGVVNIIMGADKQPLFSEPAYAYLDPETIRFKSDGTLSGFQFQLIGPQIDQLELRSLLPGFEYIKYLSDDTLTGVIFSLDNKLIPEGEVNLFDIKHHPGTLAWGQLFAGNSKGDYVPVYKDATSLPEDYRYNFVLYPNPSDGAVTLSLSLPESSDIEIAVFNTLGQLIYQENQKNLRKGDHKLQFNISNQSNSKGLQFVSINYRSANSPNKTTFRKVLKIIIQ
ncbi:MAG: S8 family serine peptidase [Bacteroidales bacterium]|nr:S8 family serine peptidase [Bacteroidales bacterium]